MYYFAVIFGRIERMFKTFFRRWYLLNNLYHYYRRRHNLLGWAEESEFLNWVAGQPLEIPKHWVRYTPPKTGRVHLFILDFLLGIKKTSIPEARVMDRMKKLKLVMDEIAENGEDWLKRMSEVYREPIRLTPLGFKVYSVSYIIFGHDYAKRVWTGLIITGIGVYLTGRISEVTKPFSITEQKQVEIFRRCLNTIPNEVLQNLENLKVNIEICDKLIKND